MSETDSMDVDSEYELPGGDDFEDITALLPHTAKGKSCWSTKIFVPLLCRISLDMAPDEVILTDGFTLMDAMSAFEVSNTFCHTNNLLMV